MKKICIIVVFGRLLVDQKKRERSFVFCEKERSIDRLKTLCWSWCLNKKKEKKRETSPPPKIKKSILIEQKYFHHHHSSFCWDKQRRRRRRFVILFRYYFEEEEGVVVVKTTTKTPTTQKQTNTHRIRVIKHTCVQFPSSSSQKILRAVRSTQVHAHLSLAP